MARERAGIEPGAFGIRLNDVGNGSIRKPRGPHRAALVDRAEENGVGEALRYFCAEPQHCVCIFVGTQQAYDPIVAAPDRRTSGLL
jgi:hypothetical protein